MISPDVAMAMLINRTTQAYQQSAPVYMTYRERTHVSAPSLGRTQDVNRTVAVRVADDFAVMQDLPNGGTRTGQAFPIIPYFDPFSVFGFKYFANLKSIDITLNRSSLYYFAIPTPDPTVSVTIPYNSFWVTNYAPDSTEDALHLLSDPTSRSTGYYPKDVVEDPQTHLPSHIEMHGIGNDDTTIDLDYRVIDGHWVLVHGTFSATEHFITSFKVIADITYDQIQFPTAPPDPLLAGTPGPTASP